MQLDLSLFIAWNSEKYLHLKRDNIYSNVEEKAKVLNAKSVTSNEQICLLETCLLETHLENMLSALCSIVH